jgi:RNA polymerase sigma-70 factor (ECF subfamily)
VLALTQEKAQRNLSPMTSASDEGWIAAFHAGHHSTLEAIYRDHYDTVDRAIGSRLEPVDRETVLQELFLRLITSDTLRSNYRGGSFIGWLSKVASNQAIDFARRQARELPLEEAQAEQKQDEDLASEVSARQLIQRFLESLPPKWRPLFEARFLRQLDQRSAAAELGMRRTTLAFHELRIRGRLRRFLLKEASQ